MTDLAVSCTREAFGALVGVSRQAIDELVNEGVLQQGAPAGEWLLVYCARLREAAAGRASPESIDLMRANKLLADEKRRSLEIKNAVADKQFAPVALLTEVVAAASQAAATHFDGIVPGMMRAGLDLTEAQRTSIGAAIARARNEFVDKCTDVALLDLLDGGDDAADAPDDDGEGETNP